MLYILAMEALVCAVLDNQGIQGIIIDNIEKKVNLAADDTLFIIKSHQQSFDRLMHTVEQFHQISNLKVNKSKSIIIRLGKGKDTNYRLEHSEEFLWSQDGSFKYLGLQLSVLSNSYVWTVKNFDPLIDHLKHILRARDTIYMDILARIAIEARQFPC